MPSNLRFSNSVESIRFFLDASLGTIGTTRFRGVIRREWCIVPCVAVSVFATAPAIENSHLRKLVPARYHGLTDLQSEVMGRRIRLCRGMSLG